MQLYSWVKKNALHFYCLCWRIYSDCLYLRKNGWETSFISRLHAEAGNSTKLHAL